MYHVNVIVLYIYLMKKKTYVRYELSNIFVILFFFLIFTFSLSKDGYYLYIITFVFSFFLLIYLKVSMEIKFLSLFVLFI